MGKINLFSRAYPRQCRQARENHDGTLSLLSSEKQNIMNADYDPVSDGMGPASPLFDRLGRLIGIVGGICEYGLNLNLAIPIESAAQALERASAAKP